MENALKKLLEICPAGKIIIQASAPEKQLYDETGFALKDKGPREFQIYIQFLTAPNGDEYVDFIDSWGGVEKTLAEMILLVTKGED